MISVPQDRPAGLSASGWLRPLLAFGVGTGMLLVVFAPTFEAMASTWWRSGTFAHGMLIYPICAWLVWRERDRLVGVVPRVEPRGLIALAVLLVTWALANVADVLVIQEFAVTAMIVAMCITTLGRDVAREMWFPLAFSLFAVPFGEGLTPILMNITAAFTVSAVEAVGIPIFRDGMMFSLPSGNFEVARACSGIRYLIASTALGTLYAYLTFRSTRRRLLFMVAAVLMPIVANGLRAFGIVMIAHFTQMKYAVGIDHLIYGWLFFGVVIFLLFWLGSLFREDDEVYAGGTPVAGAVVGAHAQGTPYALGRAGIVLAGAGSAMVLTAALASFIVTSPMRGAPAVPGLPVATRGWSGPLAPQSTWGVSYPGASHLLRARYERTSDGRSVEVAVAVIDPAGDEGAGELVNSMNQIAADWSLVEKEQSLDLTGVTSPSAPAVVNASAWSDPGAQRTIWQWYAVGGGAVASPLRAKADEIRQVIARRSRPAASIVVSVQREDRGDLRSPLLEDFVSALGASLVDCAIATTALDNCSTGTEAAPAGR